MSSQFEPTAADGDSESGSDQAQNKKSNHRRNGKCMQHVAGDWVVMGSSKEQSLEVWRGEGGKWQGQQRMTQEVG